MLQWFSVVGCLLSRELVILDVWSRRDCECVRACEQLLIGLSLIKDLLHFYVSSLHPMVVAHVQNELFCWGQVHET